jgi:preprotein translocase subunit YajC
MNLVTILLQGGGFSASSLNNILLIVALIAIFYLFMIRPQQKRQKDIQKAREAIKPGDRIVTSGGVYGKVKEINEKHMLVEIADNVRIRIDKNSVFASPEDAQQK